MPVSNINFKKEQRYRFVAAYPHDANRSKNALITS